MENCIFCKIIRDESPSYKFYEDAQYIGILSIFPLNKGHALIIPKKHMRWVWDSEDIGGYFQVVQKIVRALKHAFATDFVVGAQVGEEVHHAHVSLVPRFTDDGHGDFLNSTIKRDFSADEMNQIADAIRQHLP